MLLESRNSRSPTGVGLKEAIWTMTIDYWSDRSVSAVTWMEVAVEDLSPARVRMEEVEVLV